MSTDYKKLVRKGRSAAMTLFSHGRPEQALEWRMADAVESLVRERDALRAQLDAIATVSALAGGYTNDGRFIEMDSLPGEIDKILDGNVTL